MSKYQIIVTPNYYTGTCGAPTRQFLSCRQLPKKHNDYHNEDYAAAVFETKKDALLVIEQLSEGPYYLADGEAGAPYYNIVSDAGLVNRHADCVCADDCLEYELIKEEDIPIEVRGAVVEYCVAYNHDDGEHTSFTGEVEHGDYVYYIAFLVDNIAVEIDKRSLRAITWENPSYFREEI